MYDNCIANFTLQLCVRIITNCNYINRETHNFILYINVPFSNANPAFYYMYTSIYVHARIDMISHMYNWQLCRHLILGLRK